MPLSPEQAKRLAAQTQYPKAWKWEEGPNPIVGEYVDDSEAKNRYDQTKRIKVIIDVDGQAWAVWLLGQLDVQWDELEHTPVHGDIVSFWVKPEKKQGSGPHAYHPSRIVVEPSEDASPASAAPPVAGPAERTAGEATNLARANEQLYLYLERTLRWPVTVEQGEWISKVGPAEALRILKERDGV